MANYICYFIIWGIFFRNILKPRFTPRVLILCDTIWFVSLTICNYAIVCYTVPEILRLMSGFVFPIIYVIVAYKDTVVNKIVALITYSTLIIICDAFVTFICVFILRASLKDILINVRFTIVGMLLSDFVNVLAHYYAARLIKSWQNGYTLKRMQYFALFLVCQLIIIVGSGYIWIWETSSWIPVVSIFFVLGVMLSGKFLLFTIRDISQKANISVQNNYLEEQRQLQMLHYNNVYEQYTQIRKLRHDILNHLRTFEILDQQGEFQLRMNYIEQLIAQYESISNK